MVRCDNKSEQRLLILLPSGFVGSTMSAYPVLSAGAESGLTELLAHFFERHLAWNASGRATEAAQISSDRR